MNVRGIIPSLGAGGSLIAAAVCALAVFGGVLAFRGESPGTAEANSGDVTLPVGAVRAQTVAAKRAPVAVATPVAPAPRRRATAPRPVRRRATLTLPRPVSRAPRATAKPPAAAPAPVPAPAPAPKPAPPAAAPRTGAVEHAVAQTRAAADPVVQAAPAPVRPPVNRVADTVQHVGATVDQTVAGLLGP